MLAQSLAAAELTLQRPAMLARAMPGRAAAVLRHRLRKKRYAPSSRFSPQRLRSACMPQRGRSSHAASWLLPLRCGRGSFSHPHPPEGATLTGNI